MRDFLARWMYRIVAFGFFCVFLFLAYLLFKRYGPDIRLDERLPAAFHLGTPWVLWGWVLLLGGLATLCIRRARRLARQSRGGEDTGADEFGPGRFGPLLIPTKFEAVDPIFLALGPSREGCDRLFSAAGFMTGDRAVLMDQPWRALLLNLAGDDDSERDGGRSAVAEVCWAIRRADPEAPRLRGVFVVMPVDQLGRPGVATEAERISADLGAIRRELELDVPIYVIVVGLERIPGFVRLAALRGGGRPQQAEWGITFGRVDGAEDGEVERRLAEYDERIRRRCLGYLLKQFPDSRANAELIIASLQAAELRPAIVAFCTRAIPRSPTNPMFLRGISLTATGLDPDERAYTLSALRFQGYRDRSLTNWSERALAADQRLRGRARRLAAFGGGAAALVWAYIILGLRSLDAAGYALAILVAGWAVAITLLARRLPAATRPNGGEPINQAARSGTSRRPSA